MTIYGDIVGNVWLEGSPRMEIRKIQTNGSNHLAMGNGCFEIIGGHCSSDTSTECTEDLQRFASNWYAQ
jgi:hypothetical protein